MADWAELRVHGVSGTPAKAMLGTDREPRRFPLGPRTDAYRPQDGDGHVLPGPDGQVLEAFHWGRHTSGSREQALWLLLLPFGMANAAQFMLPRGSGVAVPLRGLCGALLRLLSLVLTVLFVLAVAVAVLDLTVWQYLGGADWFSDGYLRPALVVGLLVCAAAVLFLAGLARRSAARASSADRPAVDSPAGRPRGTEKPPGFSSPDFFDGDPDAPTLRRLHVSAGFLTVALLGWASAERSGDTELAPTAFRLTAWSLAGTAALVVMLGDAPGARLRPDVGRSVWGPVAAALSFVALGAAVFSGGAAAGALLWGGGTPRTGGALPAVDAVVALVAAVGLIALVGLFAGVVLLGVATARDARAVPGRFRRFAHGWAGALVAGLGLFLGAGYTAAVTYLLTGFLWLLPGPAVHTTPLLQRVAFGWGVLAAVLIVIGGLLVLRVRSRTARHAAVAVSEFGDTDGGNALLDTETARRVGRAMALARLKNCLPPVLLTVAVVGGLLALATLAEQWAGRCQGQRCRPGDLAGAFGWLSGVPETGSTWVRGFAWFGVAMLLLLAVALALIAAGAYRGADARRRVNVVWDVISFWPRAAHPIVPLPYSQDVVPDLRDRIHALLDEGEVRRVVVAAHSQGSLVALAALQDVDPRCYPRLGVLTCGSQLRVIFPRAFPAHVGYDVVDWLRRTFGGCWVSLYRETDPIGGPVSSWHRSPGSHQPTSCRLGGGPAPQQDTIDPATLRRECGQEWRLIDPPVRRDVSPPTVAADLRGHSDYWLDPDWCRAVQAALPRGAATTGGTEP